MQLPEVQENNLRVTNQHSKKNPASRLVQVNKPGNYTWKERVENYPGDEGKWR